MPIWKEYPKCPGYEVSYCGKVKKGNVLFKTHVRPDGYVSVSIKGRNRLLHRVVAKTWHANPLNLPEVNHNDGNKQNNRADNLKWVTAQENTDHKYHVLGYKNPKGLTKGNKYAAIPVAQSLNEKLVGIYPSAIDAAKALCLKHSTAIHNCIHQRNKGCAGYYWKQISKQDYFKLLESGFVNNSKYQKRLPRSNAKNCLNIETGIFYDSIMEAARSIPMSIEGLRYRISTNRFSFIVV